MNIQEAKQEISNTLRAYLQKDEQGNYRYPLVRQRPILLMGPPGIGKTAILEQVARECQVGLVAYSLTHHTRQSAVGLPHIEKVQADGREMEITRYTMSEIVAEIYSYMEKTGKREGILFLDEINCVSETLAPTMLQLLQNKMFGSHPLPKGWILVTAGNPPEYNKSVREFDVATLDRVRTIPVEADCGVWLEYGRNHHVHGAILSYLAIRPEHFYRVEEQPEGKFFVTARGWEDLSELITSYEELEIPVTLPVIREYLQQKEIAEDFAAYYGLYRKYQQDYGIPEILDGSLQNMEDRVQMARSGSFEERFTVVGLVADALGNGFRTYSRQEQFLLALRENLQKLKTQWGPEQLAGSKEKSLQILLDAGLADRERRNLEMQVIETLKTYDLELKKLHIREKDEGFTEIAGWYDMQIRDFRNLTEKAAERLRRAFRFLEQCFGDGQEMVLFMTELAENTDAMGFIAQHGSKEFLKHSDVINYRQQEQKLQDACRSLMN